MSLSKEAVRLAVPGVAEAVACEGCPPLARLFQQYAGGAGELLACPYCVDARKIEGDSLVANARVAGATPLFEWIGDGATVFSTGSTGSGPRADTGSWCVTRTTWS